MPRFLQEIWSNSWRMFGPASKQRQYSQMDSPLLEAAEAALSSGDLAVAEALCGRLLEDSSGEAAANHLLGLVALKRKNPQEAVRLIERAIEGGLINTIVLSNCGEAYRQLGRLDE